MQTSFSRNLLVFSLFVGAALVSAGPAVDFAAKTKSIQAQFVGHSGQVKLFPNANSTSFMKLNIGLIEEVAPNTNANVSGNNINSFGNGNDNGNGAGTGNGNSGGGNGNGSGGSNLPSIQTLANTDFSWQGPISTTVGSNNDSAVMVFMTTTLNVVGSTVPFIFTAYMVNETVDIEYGNDTVTTNENSLKFSLSFGAWPFADISNWLHVTLQVSASGNTSQFGNFSTPPNGAGNTDVSVTYGDGSIALPQLVILDGESFTNMRATPEISGNQLTIHLYFPAYNSSLFYDPVMSFGSSVSSVGTTPTPSPSVEPSPSPSVESSPSPSEGSTPSPSIVSTSTPSPGSSAAASIELSRAAIVFIIIGIFAAVGKSGLFF